MKLLLTESELAAWLKRAQPGERMNYHRGNLARDTDNTLISVLSREATALDRIKRHAYAAMQSGSVHLVQRRNGCDDYSYFAIARTLHSPSRGSWFGRRDSQISDMTKAEPVS